MAEQAYAYVTLIPVAEGFQRKIAQELKGVGGVGGTAGKTTGKNFSDGFGGQLKKLGLLAAGALATAGVGRLLGDSIKQASDLGESLNAVNVVFEESAAGIAKIGESASKNLGLSQTEFNAAAVQFSSFAEKIAGDGGDVVGTIDELTTRGADFASVMNLEVSEALRVFQSGLAGETEPLKRFGIDLSAAAIETYALEAGIIAAGESMTETQKVQARYGALMEQTAKTSGDFANTSGSLANQQRILKAEFTNIQASVGVALIPVLEKLQQIVIDRVLPAFEDFGDWLASPAGTEAVESLTNVITGLVEFTLDLIGAIHTALPILAALGTAFIVMQGKVILAHTAIKLATISQLGLNAAMAANPIGLVITALAALAIGIGAFINATQKATPTQEDLNDELARTNSELEFYREQQDKSTNSNKLYESTIADLEARQRELRAALQDSYNWTEEQTAASYRNRDAAIEQRFATKDLKGEVDRYTDSVRLSSGALISNAVLQEAQRAYIQDYNYSLGRTTKTLQDWIDELTDRNYAELQGISTAEFYSTATDDVATSTVRATGAVTSLNTELDNQTGIISSTAGEVDGLSSSYLNAANSALIWSEANYQAALQSGAAMTAADGQASITDLLTGTGLAEDFASGIAEKVFDNQVGISKTGGGNVAGSTGFVSIRNKETGQTSTFSEGVLIDISPTDERQQESSFDFTRRVFGGTTGFQEFIKEQQNTVQAIENQTSVIEEGSVVDTALATGGLVTGPTKALIGEAGPELVIPLNKFESMLDQGNDTGKTLVYNAAANQSLDSEQELFTAMRRAKVVANW